MTNIVMINLPSSEKKQKYSKNMADENSASNYDRETRSNLALPL